MEVFNDAKARYSIGDHAAKRFRERVLKNDQKISQAKIKGLTRLAIEKGYVFLDHGHHRYIRSGELFIPCQLISKNHYFVKSILLWKKMVARERDIIFRDIIQK